MKQNFDEWFSNFRPNIAGYDYYANFTKVIKNVNQVKINLNILNSLIGSKNIEQDFEKIIELYPETLKCIPLLLAVRKDEIHAIDENGSFIYRFDEMNYSIEQYKYFCRKTGLFDLISKHIINNLVDYVFGVETGLDSHARKNRGGKCMENLVESFLQKDGFVKNENYLCQASYTKIEQMWSINLSELVIKERAEKKLDFVVRTNNRIYGIETNFYASGGSKLNETARSYQLLNEQSLKIKGFTFIWITDGLGWLGAKSNLREAFNEMNTLFSINDLENGVLTDILQ